LTASQVSSSLVNSSQPEMPAVIIFLPTYKVSVRLSQTIALSVCQQLLLKTGKDCKTIVLHGPNLEAGFNLIKPSVPGAISGLVAESLKIVNSIIVLITDDITPISIFEELTVMDTTRIMVVHLGKNPSPISEDSQLDPEDLKRILPIVPIEETPKPMKRWLVKNADCPSSQPPVRGEDQKRVKRSESPTMQTLFEKNFPSRPLAAGGGSPAGTNISSSASGETKKDSQSRPLAAAGGGLPKGTTISSSASGETKKDSEPRPLAAAGGGLPKGTTISSSASGETKKDSQPRPLAAAGGGLPKGTTISSSANGGTGKDSQSRSSILKEQRPRHLEIPSDFIPLLGNDEGKRTPPPPHSVLQSPSSASSASSTPSGDSWLEKDITTGWSTNVFMCGILINIHGIHAIRGIEVSPFSRTSFIKSYNNRLYVNQNTQLVKSSHSDIERRIQSGTAKYIYSNQMIIGCYDRVNLVFYHY